MKHLFMTLDETMSLMGQAHALRRVKDLPGVFNVQAQGEGYKVTLDQCGQAMLVMKKAREVNCVNSVTSYRRALAMCA